VSKEVRKYDGRKETLHERKDLWGIALHRNLRGLRRVMYRLNVLEGRNSTK